MAKAEKAAAALPDVATLRDSYWRSLRYFSLYRLIVAGFFFAVGFLFSGTINIGAWDVRLFRWVSLSYVVIATLSLWAVTRFRVAFNQQLSFQVALDVIALTLLIHASGGARSGVDVMLFVVLGGAGLVGQGRLTLFYAALATCALLGEHAYRVLALGDDPAEFFRIGLTSIGFFGTAIVARLLSRRVVTHETLARLRGVELANQMQINQRVIRDMQDGVLVVEPSGRVRQHNPQAEALLGVRPGAWAALVEFSPALADRFADWIAEPREMELEIAASDGTTKILARLLPPGEGGDALIYLEDMGRAQAQAQQMKLAALGRLTANMAHEIRNPLSAISHAAELLPDETSADGIKRLVRIIGDNSRRLDNLVIEILELGRRDRAHQESIQLQTFLTQFLDEFAVHDPAVREQIRLHLDGDPVLRFDRSHLHRVVWNLLVNARRYASGGAHCVRLLACTGIGGTAEVHVIDDGPGIDVSQHAQVFEPFFTTHGAGTGLGLYIARELCDANGARLDLVDNAPGAHFRITGRREHFGEGTAQPG